MPPPATQTEIDRLHVRLSGAHVRRYPLANTLNDLRTEHARKTAEISNLRLEIRQAAQEAQYALDHHHVDARRMKEGVIAELEGRMARLAREWEELSVRIENVSRDLRELDQEITGLARMLNLNFGGN